MIDLYRISKCSWVVVAAQGDSPKTFTAIEPAAEYMEAAGVNSDHIDDAICQMASYGNTHARFTDKGKFAFSDDIEYPT
jgi:hypothetical protein